MEPVGVGICEWSYDKLPHIVTIKNFEGSEFTEQYQFPSDEIEFNIEYDDSVKIITQKVSSITGYRPDFLHMYVENSESEEIQLF